MKTFEELITEAAAGVVSVEVDHVGDTSDVSEFLRAGKAFGAKIVGNVNGNTNTVIRLSGKEAPLYKWLKDNYDEDLDQSDFNAFIV